VLALASFAKSKSVIVSRGELIEIGGSFRMPDVIAQSGARMCEVGTTNKTHIADYEHAIDVDSAVILTTHPSNYRIVGFTARPSLEELVAVAHKHGLLLIEDLGSGTLVDLTAGGLENEPTVQQSVAAGVDLVSFSGDKLLGGPQAGILLGRSDLIAVVKCNPLLRALRIDKMSLAALEATLRLYLPPHDPLVKVPVLRMIMEDPGSIGRRARRVLRRVESLDGLSGKITDGVSYAGGGALPMSGIPTKLLKLNIDGLGVEEFARRLRCGSPPVVGRIADNSFMIDLRTVAPEETDALAAAIGAAAA